jgi:hypothetical protein
MNLNELEIGSASIGGSKKLYMGIAPIQIIMVNPSVSQLAEFYNTDVDKIKDPSYVKDGEVPSTRLDFYYTNHPDFDKQFKGKFSIFVQGNTRESKAGKKQYIDAFTRTSWSNNLSELSAAQENVKDFLRLDMSTVREAKPGEETIYNLLKAYGNIVPKTKALELNDFKQLIKGNGKELQDFFNHFNGKGDGVNVMMGIKDAKYQDIYTGVFMPLKSKLTDYVKKSIEGEYGFKSFYQGYSFTEFIPSAAPEGNEVSENTSSPMLTADYTPFSDTPNVAPSVTSSSSDLF